MKELESLLKRNWEALLERVEKACLRAGRKRGEVKILGASKGQSPEKIRLLASFGLNLLGENYVQEAESKREALKDLSLEWHFIGRLQTNKVKRAIKLFHLLETVDRISLAEELEKRLAAEGRVLPIFIEVNIGHEPTKGGVLPENLVGFAEEILKLPHLEVRGLMCLPPWSEDPEKVRPYFIRMRELFEELKPIFGASFRELSMGTSHDFEVAIEEGATLIRVGTLLFGPRT